MGLLVERVFAQRVHPVLSSLFAQVCVCVCVCLCVCARLVKLEMAKYLNIQKKIGAVSSAGVLVLVLCDTYKECLSFSQSVSSFETGEVQNFVCVCLSLSLSFSLFVFLCVSVRLFSPPSPRQTS